MYILLLYVDSSDNCGGENPMIFTEVPREYYAIVGQVKKVLPFHFKYFGKNITLCVLVNGRHLWDTAIKHKSNHSINYTSCTEDFNLTLSDVNHKYTGNYTGYAITHQHSDNHSTHVCELNESIPHQTVSLRKSLETDHH